MLTNKNKSKYVQDERMMAKVNALRELQSATGEKLRPLFGQTLLPSVLRPSGGAFKGEL